MILIPRQAMLGVFVLSCVASGGMAVELRNTVGESEVIRQVSFMRPIELEAPVIDYELQVGDVGAACTSCGEHGCFLDCLLPARKWAKFEYLLWWRKGMDLPPLAITSSDTADLNNLRLGLPTTTTLFGGDTIGDDARPGGRVSLGFWLGDCENCAIETRFYSLGRQRIKAGEIAAA